MLELMRDIVGENRTIIGPGYDRALARLGRDLPLEVHEVPSGSSVWTWQVPDAWEVKEAWFEADGRRYADVREHPLHVWSHSLPFDGWVTREELLEHITTYPDRPHTIPFDFRYYERGWGFCLPHATLEELTADRYYVRIATEEGPGTLKVGEHVIPGASADSILVVAHLDHPGQANDDLAGVAVAHEVARRLAGVEFRHTLRFVFLPEHIGSVAYLSLHEDRLGEFKHGMFLEMLGIDQPFALQRSRQDDAPVDRAAVLALEATGQAFEQRGFLQVIANDEQVINGPGVDVPCISISRAKPQQVDEVGFRQFHSHLPYPQYHSSDDSMEIIDADRLEESVQLVCETLRILDADAFPRRLYRGTVQLSRYGLWVDWRVDPKLNERIDYLMWCFEGDKSLSQIARETELPFDTVREYVDRFVAAGLVELGATPWPQAGAK